MAIRPFVFERVLVELVDVVVVVVFDFFIRLNEINGVDDKRLRAAEIGVLAAGAVVVVVAFAKCSFAAEDVDVVIFMPFA